jgi:branched-chain amino acid transport system ATP-binding protein
VFQGQSLLGKHPSDAARMGIAHVPEGRGTMSQLTVWENLRLGAYVRRDREVASDLEQVFTYFPVLKERRKQYAGTLSGGEQQMLAIGRALMARPKLMLLDEPSMGLAPMLVQEIFDIVVRLNREEQVAILLAEQNAAMALRVVQYGYVMENGRIVLDGDAKMLRENEDVKEFYLGLTGVGQRRSYRDVKHYRRRKRWLS